jgi:uncharacterized protein
VSDYPAEWYQAIAQFQAGDYYACHDTIEAIWIDAIEPDKKFYQGVLQIAVACYHLHNCNWQGAVVLLGEGIGRLRNYPTPYGDIDVEKLRVDSYQLLQKLQEIGRDRIDTFVESLATDRSILPTIDRK